MNIGMPNYDDTLTHERAMRKQEFGETVVDGFGYGPADYDPDLFRSPQDAQIEYMAFQGDPYEEQMKDWTPEERARYEAWCNADPTQTCPDHGEQLVKQGLGYSTSGPDPYGVDVLECGCHVSGFSADDMYVLRTESERTIERWAQEREARVRAREGGA